MNVIEEAWAQHEHNHLADPLIVNKLPSTALVAKDSLDLGGNACSPKVESDSSQDLHLVNASTNEDHSKPGSLDYEPPTQDFYTSGGEAW